MSLKLFWNNFRRGYMWYKIISAFYLTCNHGFKQCSRFSSVWRLCERTFCTHFDPPPSTLGLSLWCPAWALSIPWSHCFTDVCIFSFTALVPALSSLDWCGVICDRTTCRSTSVCKTWLGQVVLSFSQHFQALLHRYATFITNFH